MITFNKKELLKEPSIRKVRYEDEDYFAIEDVARLKDVDLSRAVATILPVLGKYIRMATVEDMQSGVRCLRQKE